MQLTSISLVNYKNFDSLELEFKAKINCFVGQNGAGKTNILDAIYHLSFGKSYFNPVTSQNIKHGCDFFVVNGIYDKGGRDEKIVVSVKKGQKKIIKKNGKNYDRFADHIGQLPLVIVSPSDRNLITDGSEVRRKFMDGVISQSDPIYLKALLSYSKILTQRNALLKYFAVNNTFDNDTLAVYNQQLDDYGQVVYQKRKNFLNEFIPIFISRYKVISGGGEEVNISYKSMLSNASMSELLVDSLVKDKAVQYTTVGVHKDDLILELDGFNVKKFGSQGQQKSFIIALKLAQFDFIKEISGVSPILLLDDIFDKLDSSRVTQIVKLVNDASFGQLFISDTHADRTEMVVNETGQSFEIFKIGS